MPFASDLAQDLAPPRISICKALEAHSHLPEVPAPARLVEYGVRATVLIVFFRVRVLSDSVRIRHPVLFRPDLQ